MFAPARIAAPADTPVSLVEAKAHLRVTELDGDGNPLPHDDDTLITALIAAATDHLDGWTGILGRALVTQTWRQDFASFRCLRLPLGPVSSITAISYYDGQNTQQTLAETSYALFADALGPYADLKSDQSWPSTYSRPDAVSVTYVAGVPAADVPPALKAAIIMHVKLNYEPTESAEREAVQRAIDALIAPYRRIGV